MPVTKVWTEFGDDIQMAPQITLAAYLGHSNSIRNAKEHGIAFPTVDDFHKDKSFDPNPHGLETDKELLDLQMLIHSLTVWGFMPVWRAVNVCSHLQCVFQVQCDPKLVALRNSLAHSVQNYIDLQSESELTLLGELLKKCRKTYAPHEHAPDSKEAAVVWRHLGSPWFAAETIYHDWSHTKHDGAVPPESQSTWCARNSVWPKRAANAACNWADYAYVKEAIIRAVTQWAVSMTAS